MLVQCDNPELLSQDYQPLTKNIQYRVLAISTDLVSGSIQSYALLWDPECKDSEDGLAHPWFVELSSLKIVEPSLPDDWQVIYFKENINIPSLVYSFKELLDLDFFIRVHDADATSSDVKVLRRYFDQYGGNHYM